MNPYLAMNILGVAGIFIIQYLLPRLPKREKFLSTTDPEATGIERPLWGPLFKVNGYNEEKSLDFQRYHELKDVPECSTPYGVEVPFWGSHSVKKCRKVTKGYSKYEDDKI